MSEKTAVSLSNAITSGLSEATLARTLELFNQHLHTRSERSFNFRGDLAENHQYDKIKPLMTPPRTEGFVVIIEATSHKTGDVGQYQILGNQWKLIEVLAKLD